MIYHWGDTRRYNSYSNYFRKLLGGRVQKVSIDAGFTCPNRDGKVSSGGCTFCNNKAFSPSYCSPDKSVAEQIFEGQQFHNRRYGNPEGYLAYFQSFSNTYAPLEELKIIYDQALNIDGIVGLVIGTRPDCVDEQKLDYFAELSKDHYIAIEYGVESCYDKTLDRINRGHDFESARRAIEMTSDRGIHNGAHFILGLPGETPEMMITQTELINSLPINTVKFHQLQIFKQTIMAKEFEQHPEDFTFFSVDEYIDLFTEILSGLRSDIVVERFAGEAPPRFHVMGDWGALRNETLIQKLEKRLAERDLWQGCRL